MGVDRSDYVVVGYKLPGKIKHKETGEELNMYEDEHWLSMMEGRPGEEYSIIDDGMSGEYIVFGKVIASADDKYEGFDFQEINLDVDKAAIKEKFWQLFSDYDGYTNTEPKLFIFSHFS